MLRRISVMNSVSEIDEQQMSIHLRAAIGYGRVQKTWGVLKAALTNLPTLLRLATSRPSAIQIDDLVKAVLENLITP